MNSLSVACASALLAAGRLRVHAGALRRQETAASSTVTSSSGPRAPCPMSPLPAHAGALRHHKVIRSAHVLRRSREPVAVTRSANSAYAALLRLAPLAGGIQGLSSVHPVRLARRHATASVSGLGQQGRRRSLARPAPARTTPGMPPNMSVNRSANGMAPGPRSARCPCCASRPRRHAGAARLPLR